jgi:hypothetical protein
MAKKKDSLPPELEAQVGQFARQAKLLLPLLRGSLFRYCPKCNKRIRKTGGEYYCPHYQEYHND